MEVKYEVNITIEDNIIYHKEFLVENSDKQIIKAAVISAIKQCGEICLKEVRQAIDEYGV